MIRRIRWGNVIGVVALVFAVVYAGAVVWGVARVPGIPATLGTDNQPGSAPTTSTQALPTAAPTPALQPTTAPLAIPAPTTRPTPQDVGFVSEVAVPQSEGSFPLGYITVAFDKEFPPYAPVVLLYQEKFAEKRGLGVHFVPFDIEDRNRISEARRSELLQSGGFDVLLTTLNSYALWGGPDVGRITAAIGESAGADKAIVQATSIRTFNDLAGKAIAYSDGSVSEYLLYYMLRAGGVSVDQVTRFGHENLNQAVRRFTNREAHGVIGWTSSDLDLALKRPDSTVLMTSKQFRVTTDVVVTGAKALQTKREAIQAFHNAWFEANKLVFEHPDVAAQSMSRWGGKWTGVESPQDLSDALGEFAQATLADNQVLMADDTRPLLESRFKEAQAVWLSGRRQVHRLVSDAELSSVFEPAFVARSARDDALRSEQPPVNPTFHLTAKPQISGLTAEQQSRLNALAVLSVREIQFDQGSTTLSATAQQEIASAVIPVLRNTVGMYLKLEASAGWPADAGLNETAINALAFERARAVQDYIIKFGIPVQRLVVGTILPLCHQCKDEAQVQRDNRVVFTLAAPE